MILNHLWGLHAHPHKEWQSIRSRREEILYSISHILLIALIPAICSYFSAVYLGWYVNLEEVITLSPKVALLASVAMYFLLVGGVLTLALLAWKMANSCGATATFTQALELSSYAATPLLICGFGALFPHIWFMVTLGIVGILYSIYLLFAGVPILINVSEDKRLLYCYALVFSGLVLLLGVVAVILYVWMRG